MFQAPIQKFKQKESRISQMFQTLTYEAPRRKNINLLSSFAEENYKLGSHSPTYT